MFPAIFAAIGVQGMVLVAPAVTSSPSRDEFVAASSKVSPALKQSEKLLIDGKFEEADRLVQNVFPKDSRTPIESLVLGNVLFTRDPGASYALHKLAAEKLPSNPDAQYEWALEQHRAKEYAGALRTYDKVIAIQKEMAAPYAMAAECAMRTGEVAKAVALWKGSETAPNGSVESFESLVCEINSKDNPHRTRQQLYKKAAAKDERGAADLLLLDAAWPYDWWNTHAHNANLAHDLKFVRETFPAKGAGPLNEALCAAACATTESQGKEKIFGILKEYGYLTAPGYSVPANGKALSIILKQALAKQVFTKEFAREKFGKKILDAAATSSDADLLNVAAHLYLDTDKLEQIDRWGCERTKDPRFAASLLTGMQIKQKLTWDSPELQKARKDFPDDATIAQIALQVGAAAGKPKDELVIAAIKAEFTKFSAGGASPLGSSRPSARALRAYFLLLSK